MMPNTPLLNLAVPSDGALHDPSLTFLRSCGIGVLRTNMRRYTAAIPSLPEASVLFQRTSDITQKVEEGSAEIGIVGLDRFMEMRSEDGDTGIVIENLGFGHCELIVGVPDSWVDVVSVADLADLAMEFREEGRDLRIATKYPRMVSRYLLNGGVNHFSLVQSSGPLEVAPAMGFADVIADISSSGTTMRENRLKPLSGGAILASQACLIANRRLLREDGDKLRVAGTLVELMEAHLQSRDFYSVTANMRGETAEEVASCILEHSDISGLKGPTVSRVYTWGGEPTFSVTVIVEKERLLPAIEQLREVGGSSVTVSQPNYVFRSECGAHSRLT